MWRAGWSWVFDKGRHGDGDKVNGRIVGLLEMV